MVSTTKNRTGRLAQEILVVLKSPYPTSLKRLFNCTNDVDCSELKLWAEGNGCQIEALAIAVLEGLQLWPFSLDILRAFCGVESFRNAVLLQKPELLAQLLEKALDGKDVQSPCARTCLSMLSSPLPGNYPVPASVTGFLEWTVKAAVEEPCAASIRPVYSLLCGLGVDHLNILPVDIVIALQNSLIKVLKSLNEHVGNLLCLAVFANFHLYSELRPGYSSGSSPWSISSGEKEQAAKHPEDIYGPSRQFFQAKRASKTMDLVVLRMILACSSNSELKQDQALEILELSKVIIGAIEGKEKNAWHGRNSAKVDKLIEKVLRKDLDPRIQTKALEALALFSNVKDLPLEIIQLVEGLLLREEEPSDHGDLIQIYGSRLRESFIKAQLQEALRVAVTPTTNPLSGIRELKNMINYVKALLILVDASPDLRRIILVSISSNELRDLLASFLASAPVLVSKSASLDHDQGCPCILGNIQCKLHSDISTLLLKTALLSQPTEMSIETSCVTALLEKHATMSGLLSTCGTFSASNRPVIPTLSLLEIQNTPLTLHDVGTWRIWLKDELDCDVARRHETVIRTLGAVCRDLERRCHAVEEPLRTEQAKVSKLQSQFGQVKASNISLEGEVQDAKSIIDGMGQERAEILDQLQSSEQNCRTLSNNLQRLEEELHAARREASRSEEVAKERLGLLELEQLALKNGKDEIIEEQQQELHTLKQSIEDLNSIVSQEQNAAAIGRNTVEHFKTLLTTSELHVSELKASVTEHRNDIISLEDLKLDLSNKLEAKQVEFHERLSEELKQRQVIQQSLSDQTTEAQEQQERCASEMKSKDDEIKALETELSERASEFAQAQDLSSRLMALVGGKPAKTDFPHPLDTNAKNTTTEIPIGSEDRTPTTAHTVSFGSSTSSKSGPTPKRARSRPSFKTPATVQPKVIFGRKNVKSAHRIVPGNGRSPLKDIGNAFVTPGPSHDKRGEALVETPKRDDTDAHDVENFSFDHNDIFTSTETPAQQDQDPGNVCGHMDIYDDTTATLS